jgi:pyroglutamyl-peptidase
LDLRANILLTFFEPFGGSETNISQQVAEEIVADGLIKCCLPVSFKRSPQVLREAIERYQPQFILSLGQCAEGEKIRLERFAINMMDSAKGDNDGYCPDEQTIVDNAPLALRTCMNIKQLYTECVNVGLPVIISNSAGLYVCNRIYWEALCYIPNALFVHIPKNIDLEIAKKIIDQIINGYEKTNKSEI